MKKNTMVLYCPPPGFKEATFIEMDKLLKDLSYESVLSYIRYQNVYPIVRVSGLTSVLKREERKKLRKGLIRVMASVLRRVSAATRRMISANPKEFKKAMKNYSFQDEIWRLIQSTKPRIKSDNFHDYKMEIKRIFDSIEEMDGYVQAYVCIKAYDFFLYLAYYKIDLELLEKKLADIELTYGAI